MSNYSKVKIERYKDLKVWQQAMEISVEVYRKTADFPQSEVFGLTSQIRRAANSISLNIAEGHARKSTKWFINFLSVSLGSLAELESGLTLSNRLNFISKEECSGLYRMISDEGKMLNSLIESLKKKIKLDTYPNP